MSTTATPVTPAEALAALVGKIMNGEAMPAPDSDPFQEISLCLGNLLRGSASERERFGILVLEHLINAGRSHIQTAQVLRNFGSGAFGDA